MPDRGQRIGRGDGRGCPAREGGADAPFRRGGRHGVPDTDDNLDYMRTAHGKARTNDLREGKITLPLLAVLDKAEPERRELLGRLARCHDDESVEYLQDAVETGADFSPPRCCAATSHGPSTCSRIRALGGTVRRLPTSAPTSPKGTDNRETH